MITVTIERLSGGYLKWVLSGTFDSGDALHNAITDGEISDIEYVLHRNYLHMRGPDCTDECILPGVGS